MSRKYSNYKVVVTQDKNIFVNEADNTSSYLETKDLYTKIKEVNQEENCIIEFIGVTPEGEEGIIFSKEFKKEVADNERLKKETDDIVVEIKDLLENLSEKKKYYQDMKSVNDKKQDVSLHKIENIRVLELNEEEVSKLKISIVDELMELRLERRKIKNEQGKLDYLYSKCNINSFIQKINSVEIPIPNDDKCAKKYNNNLSKEKIIKEIKYNSAKNRDDLIKAIKHKYSKVIDNPIDMKLTCYNKSGK